MDRLGEGIEGLPTNRVYRLRQAGGIVFRNGRLERCSCVAKARHLPWNVATQLTPQGFFGVFHNREKILQRTSIALTEGQVGLGRS